LRTIKQKKIIQEQQTLRLGMVAYPHQVSSATRFEPYTVAIATGVRLTNRNKLNALFASAADPSSLGPPFGTV
jgi:hypothetical protein